MLLQASFEEWAFVGNEGDYRNDVWKMIDGVTTPLLLWEKRFVHLIQLEDIEEPVEDVMRFYNTSEEDVSWFIDTQSLPDWLEKAQLLLPDRRKQVEVDRTACFPRLAATVRQSPEPGEAACLPPSIPQFQTRILSPK